MPLTAVGEERAAALVHALGNVDVDTIYSTPFKRTFDTSTYEGVHMNMIGALKNGSGLIVTWDDAYTAVEVERTAAPLNSDLLRSHCRTELAQFKVPREIRLVEELPRNPTGKIMRRELQVSEA